MTALSVETTPLDDVRQLIPFLDSRRPLVWLRKGEGIAGIGEALRLEFSGPDRIREASAAWRATVAAATVADDVRTPGTGLVAFGTFAFDDASSATSTLIVPEVVLGRRAGRSWITRIRRAEDVDADQAPRPRPTAFGDEYRLTLLPGTLGKDGYKAAVASAVERIREHDLSKVVLARDLTVHADARALAEKRPINLGLIRDLLSTPPAP